MVCYITETLNNYFDQFKDFDETEDFGSYVG